MLLIDALDARSDSVRIVESAGDICAHYLDSKWFVTIDNADYEIADTAMEILLNLLRVPIKYVYRCVDEDGIPLAEESINFWLKKQDLSFLIQKHDNDPMVTQVYPKSKLYLPSVKVNDLILEYLKYDVDIPSFEIEDDIFNAVYVTKRAVSVFGEDYNIGVRVLFSDCFTITPRFDGILYNNTNGSMFSWPTLGRKFRVASSTIPKVIDQIEEFLGLSIHGLGEILIPSLNSFKESNWQLIDAEAFVSRLCSDLRYSSHVKYELIKYCTQTPNHMPHELLINISAYTNKLGDDTEITLEMAREIQIALSRYVVSGSFK